MDRIMEQWYSTLKAKIVKNDDFIEDFGYINDADIANWFKTLENTFDEMLENIGVGDVDDFKFDGGSVEINRRKSYNKKKIIKLGNDIATSILTAGIEEWMTESAEHMEDDSERSISNLLGSSDYNVMLTALYEGVEYLISHIFDIAYIGARTQHDIPKEDTEGDKVEISSDLPLNPQLIDEINSIMSDGINEAIEGSIKSIIDEIEKEMSGPKRGMGDKVSNAVLNIINTELSQPIKEIAAYTFQSFMIKLPKIQERQEQSDIADQSDTPPDAELEIRDKGEYEKRRKEFEEEYKSNNQLSDRLDWFSILSKEVGLTSSASFSPAIHNTTYGNKPCKKCSKKCRCN